MDPITVVIAILAAAVGAGAAFAIERGRGAARIAVAESRLGAAEQAATRLSAERDAALAAKVGAEREAALAAQRHADMETRIADFDRLREEALQAAKAATLATAQSVSSKLIDDHKRESDAAKQAAEERVRNASAALMKQMEQITTTVAQLQGQLGEKAQVLDTVWRALTSPGGAGHFAEIGLSNTLKSFGLEEGRDFVLQHTTEDAVTGRRLRPDAVVFLPGNSVLVIDCKASKFLVDIAEAERTEREGEAYAALARTMNQHLKALAEKDYRGAIAAACRAAGRDGEPARVQCVMYLPNDAALEKLKRADADFAQKAARLQIIPAGPAGLASALAFVSVEIGFARQVANQERIAVTAERLIESVAIVLGHAQTVGKNLRTAAEAFQKLSSSVNGRLLPRAQLLVKLGLRPGKPVPPPLAAFQVHVADREIDGEAEELPVATMPRLVGGTGD